MININESNITIMVKDMDKAVSFYESIGLTLKQRWNNHYAMVTAHGITIGLHPSESNDTSSGSLSIGFMIDKIDEAKSLLDENKIHGLMKMMVNPVSIFILKILLEPNYILYSPNGDLKR